MPDDVDNSISEDSSRPLVDEDEENEQMETPRHPSEKSFLRRICHWGPLIAITIIGLITTNTLYCHLQWWPPARSFAGLLDVIVFLLWNYLCLTNLFRGASVGPGYVPLKWEPETESDKEKLQFCAVCEGFKVPRSHHCRKCNRCVMKMDHHCPWINNCCGHKNQAFFVQFLFWAVIGCFHATLILGPSIYRAVFRVWYMFYGTGKEPIVDLGQTWAMVIFCWFIEPLGAGAELFRNIVEPPYKMHFSEKNYETLIKNAIIQQEALHRQRDDRFVYPYDLGWKNNFKQVITWTGEPPHDGIYWPVRDGCDQFTFTIEQIKQKEEKREHAVRYVVVKDYDGSMFFSFLKLGCRVHCCQPMTEESRLKLEAGDHVVVTRWRRHWLYGQNLNPRQPQMQRGWFPRKCVVECVDEETDVDSNYNETTENHPHSN